MLALIAKVRQDGQPITVATLIKSEPLDLQSTFSVGTRINLEAYQKTGQVEFIGSNRTISNSPKLINAIEKLSDHKFNKRNIDYVILNSDFKSNDTSQEEVQSEWLIQQIKPQKRLLICGAGNDVMPLVIMAKMQDWHVTVIDSRAHYATRARFPQADSVKWLSLDDSKTLSELSAGAAVALMSHSLSQDRARLSILLTNPNFSYLGQLGPRYRTERLIEEINSSNSDPSRLVAGIKKLHYPIGLKLGGDGPEALALSIMAQISAVMNNQAQSDTFSHKIESLPLAEERFSTNDSINNSVKNYAYD